MATAATCSLLDIYAKQLNNCAMQLAWSPSTSPRGYSSPSDRAPVPWLALHVSCHHQHCSASPANSPRIKEVAAAAHAAQRTRVVEAPVAAGSQQQRTFEQLAQASSAILSPHSIQNVILGKEASATYSTGVPVRMSEPAACSQSISGGSACVDSGSANDSSYVASSETSTATASTSTTASCVTLMHGPSRQRDLHELHEPHQKQTTTGSDEEGPCWRMLSMSTALPEAMQGCTWSLSGYSCKKKLYQGYASKVYKARCKHSGMDVALKVYHLSAVSTFHHHQITREVRLHSRLNHPSIIQLYGAFQEGNRVVLVQEYASGGDLYRYLRKGPEQLTEQRAVNLVLLPLLGALQYLHAQGIMHRDVKLENLLLSKDGSIRLSDFGLSINMREERPVTRAGTLQYMAPEVLVCPRKSHPEQNKEREDLHYGVAVDVWALGVLSYELIMGCTPFRGRNAEEALASVTHTDPSTLNFTPYISHQARLFIIAALRKDLRQRATLDDLSRHPWVRFMRTKTLQHYRQQAIRFFWYAPEPATSRAPSSTAHPCPEAPQAPPAAAPHPQGPVAPAAVTAGACVPQASPQLALPLETNPAMVEPASIDHSVGRASSTPEAQGRSPRSVPSGPAACEAQHAQAPMQASPGPQLPLQHSAPDAPPAPGQAPGPGLTAAAPSPRQGSLASAPSLMARVLASLGLQGVPAAAPAPLPKASQLSRAHSEGARVGSSVGRALVRELEELRTRKRPEAAHASACGLGMARDGGQEQQCVEKRKLSALLANHLAAVRQFGMAYN